MNKFFMSIDLGTSSVRAFVADFVNKKYFSSGEGYDLCIPKIGYAEQVPQVWYEKTVAAIKNVLSKSGINPEQIEAVSFSGQMHGLVALNENFQPLTNAIIWLDQRSSEVLDEIYAILGLNGIFENTQNRITAGHLIGTLYWLKKYHEQIYRQIKYIMLPKDYVKFRLCGKIITDYSDAAGSLAFNNEKLSWAYPLIEALGLDSKIFPDCKASSEIIGHINHDTAKDTGLSEKTLVVNGGGDGFMQAIGNGIIHEGIVSSNIGTGGQIATTVTKPVFDPELRTSTFAHVLPKCWQLAGNCLNSGISFKWITEQVFDIHDYESVNREISECPPCSNGLFFLPYLTGERTPHMDPKARGVFLGLTPGHRRANLERSVMEGVVFALKDSLEILGQLGVDCRKIVASGGGAKSDVWLQIQADIFEREVYKSASEEQASLGAAITAAVGTGYFENFETACEHCVSQPQKVFYPRAENVEIYHRAYPIFRDIYTKNRVIFAQIASMLSKLD